MATAVLAVTLSACGQAAPLDGGTPSSRQSASTGVPGSGETTAPGQPPPSSAPPVEPVEPVEPEPAPDPETAPPDADAHTDPASVSVVVNKRRPLDPVDFAPADLVLPQVPLGVARGNAMLHPDAAQAVQDMFAEASADGVGLTLVSGYRSYTVQEDTYDHWVATKGGIEQADTVSARPGYSEHQTGLAFDVGQADGACTLSGCFRDTAAGLWAADNAHRFGFILRYQQGFEGITGFSAESWHYRYVGVETATDMRERGVATLEEYFGLPGAPDYG